MSQPEDETRSGGFGTDPPADESPTRSVNAEAPGGAGAAVPRVRGYEVLRKLGEGGMGVVFEAQQATPRRRVALKVIRGGGFDETMVRMFQREADSLAMLKHPNIGAIYESGRTADGHHYFAMELVRGPTLGEFLAARGPVGSTAELEFRLRLFREIAGAVHYAHQRGVIHRDLKPSNIVVSDDPASGSGTGSGATPIPRVKILDFGLARIAAGDGAEATTVTEVGQIKGTLQYMSPEQAQGDPQAIDLRTDVYALGVILYEMLASQRPYDVAAGSIAESIRVICETSPRPLGQVVRAMRVDADVDTIVGKALEKEPGRRYASAAELDGDLQRFLGSLPILARPPSAAYQLRKFAARNRVLVGGAAATFLMLVVAVVGTTFGMLRAQEQRRAAERAQADDDRLTEVLLQSTRGYEPRVMAEEMRADLRRALEAAGGDIDAIDTFDLARQVVHREALSRLARIVEQEAEGLGRTYGQFHAFLTDGYIALELWEQALEHQLKAAELNRRVTPVDHNWLPIAMDHGALGRIYLELGRFENAADNYRIANEMLADARRRGPTRHELGRVREWYGREMDDAFLEHALSRAGALFNLERFSEAEPVLRAALAFVSDDHPPFEERLLRVRFILGQSLFVQDRHDEAIRTFEDLVQGESDLAFEALDRFVELGGSNAGRLAREEDLVSLHGPRFDAIVAAARHNADRRTR